MGLRRDCEQSVWIPGGVVCNELTNSVSLGSERCLKRWELLTTSVCTRTCASATFDKHEEITIAALSAGLVPGRGLRASERDV